MPKTTMSTIFIFIFWLALVPYTKLELISGLLAAIIIALISKDFLFYESPKKFINPLSWIKYVNYMVLFIIEEIKSNIQTFISIITGNITPAIIKVSTNIKSETAKTLFANSITLTPGTFTLEIKDALYVHCLNYKKDTPGKTFEKNIKRLNL